MEILESVGLGLAAGAIGTVALTVAEKLEMKVTGREASAVPGQVGTKLSGHEPETNPALVKRLDPIVHWGHGIGLGAVRGLLDVAGLGALAATLVFYPIVFAGDATLYRVLGIAPAPWRWTRAELATDLFGKGILAFATSGAYILLDMAV
ncbi:MAG: hypothetical protein M3356_01840 [Actinomycetota bacterium]|nr:hypothetical protein [Actinomycetota bacterium]